MEVSPFGRRPVTWGSESPSHSNKLAGSMAWVVFAEYLMIFHVIN